MYQAKLEFSSGRFKFEMPVRHESGGYSGVGSRYVSLELGRGEVQAETVIEESSAHRWYLKPQGARGHTGREYTQRKQEPKIEP